MARIKKVQSAMQWVMVGQMVMPRLIDLVSHYTEMAEDTNSQVGEADKARMKENLRSLRLPDWDSI